MDAYPETLCTNPVSVWSAGLPLQDKLKIVIMRAAQKLPAEAGRQLLALLHPKALAIMAVVAVIWTGSQFAGVGEIADVILLIAGWAWFGHAAWQAGGCLLDFAGWTISAKSDGDLDEAAQSLAEAVTLLGVQALLAVIFEKPVEAYKLHGPRLEGEEKTARRLRRAHVVRSAKAALGKAYGAVAMMRFRWSRRMNGRLINAD